MKSLILALLLLLSRAQAEDCFQQQTKWNWKDWLHSIKILKWPEEFIEVEKVEYKKNEKASYCTRPLEMIDTVVIHHSAGRVNSTATEINDYHITRGTSQDPWYMIGYSYVINSPYQGSGLPLPKVTEGRPIEIVGPHAGTNAFVDMTKEQKKMWDNGEIVCGKSGGEFSVDSKLIKNGKIKANVTTIGIVALGNYAPFSRWNPTGHAPGKPRHPTKETLTMIAKLACQLQKKYPGIKNISWHSKYNNTSCPGSLKQKVDEIKKIAKELGCDFN